MRADVWVCVKLKGKSLKKNSFSFNFQKTSLKKFLPYIFFSTEISCKKIKNHLQFCVKILLKKISSIFTGKSLVTFFQNHTLEGVFENSLKFLQLVPNLTPIRKLLCTFLYLCYCSPPPPKKKKKKKKKS